MTRKTRAEWRRQAAERKTHLTVHYFWDARLAPPSIVRGYSSNEITARANAYYHMGLEKFNKVVVVNERTGQQICVLRRDPRTGFIDVQDERYALLLAIGKKK